MAIFCIQCGTSLPDDAAFCLKCGKQLKGSAASPSKSLPSETVLYRTEVTNIFRHMDKYETSYLDQELGGGTCIVTNQRLIFETKKSGVIQISLRDIVSVKAEAPNLIFKRYNVVELKGFGAIWVKENEELASQIKKAMLGEYTTTSSISTERDEAARRLAQRRRDSNRYISTPTEGAEQQRLKEGNTYNESGRHKEAITAYDQALQFNPKSVGAYYGRGLAYFHLQDYTRGCIDFYHALELNPNFNGSDKARKILEQVFGPNYMAKIREALSEFS